MAAFSSSDYFLLRSPLLDLEKINDLINLGDDPSIATYLFALYQDDRLRDAISLASPTFRAELDKWFDEGKPPAHKTIISLYKYTIRMGTRSTPFGLFAGISTGDIIDSEEPLVELLRNNINKISLRVDPQCIAEVTECLSKVRDIARKIRYHSNPTIYLEGNNYKFYKQFKEKNKSKNTLTQIRATPILRKILQLIDEKDNLMSYEMLEEFLKTHGASPAQSAEYIHKLHELGLLISEWQLNVVGKNYLEQLTHTLRRIDTENIYLPTVLNIADLLQKKASLSTITEHISGCFKELFPSSTIHAVLQGDLRVGMKKNKISRAILKTFEQSLHKLLVLNTPSQIPDFERFKSDFQLRFEDRMVPLLLALDIDSGIGYGSKKNSYRMMDEIIGDVTIRDSFPNTHKQHHYQDIVIKKFVESVQNQFSGIELTDDDLKEIPQVSDKNLPTSFYAIGNLLRKQVDKDIVFNLENIGGSSFGNLLSRFAYMDSTLSAAMRRSAATEQALYGSTQLAEIAYLPDIHAAHIVHRPDLRKLTIGLTVSHENNQQQVPINDLYIFAREGNLYLWSKKFNQTIEPRLTSAHNFTKSMNLYKFLADFQFQRSHLDVSWNWGTLRDQPRLPRVTYKNIILCRAQWRIAKMTNCPRQAKDRRLLVDQLRRTLELPAKVVLVNGDNHLLLHLQNQIGIDILLDQLTKGHVTLIENILDHYQTVLHDINQNSFANELVIPFHSDTLYTQQQAIPVQKVNIQRSFPLGSNWIYAKIFCGCNIADNIIKDFIPTLIGQLEEEKIIKKWFFIRYGSPSHHIRFRVEVFEQFSYLHVISAINNVLGKLLENEQITTISFDTYTREIERYTTICMEKSEELFYRESELILQKIKAMNSLSDRWKLAFHYIEFTLRNAQFTLIEKRDFCKKMYELYYKEFGGNKHITVQLNNKFKLYKHWFDDSITESNTLESDKNLTQVQQEIFELIRSHINPTEYEHKSHTLLSSYFHMFINRLFISDQRMYELGIYHFMNNFYRMQLGKAKEYACKHTQDKSAQLSPILVNS